MKTKIIRGVFCIMMLGALIWPAFNHKKDYTNYFLIVLVLGSLYVIVFWKHRVKWRNKK